eukprot:1158973-Pelagomonas_calceolata.AAC.20
MARAGMGAHSCGRGRHSATAAAEEPLQEHLRQEQFWERTAVAAAAIADAGGARAAMAGAGLGVHSRGRGSHRERSNGRCRHGSTQPWQIQPGKKPGLVQMRQRIRACANAAKNQGLCSRQWFTAGACICGRRAAARQSLEHRSKRRAAEQRVLERAVAEGEQLDLRSRRFVFWKGSRERESPPYEKDIRHQIKLRKKEQRFKEERSERKN